MIRRSPSGRYITGVVRAIPDLAPVVVSRRRGAPANDPPTLPPLLAILLNDLSIPITHLSPRPFFLRPCFLTAPSLSFCWQRWSHRDDSIVFVHALERLLV